MSWTTIGSWLLVTAVTVAAHLFGREARSHPPGEADPGTIRAGRLGVALSITGPLVVFIAGLTVAVATELWAPVGLATVVAIVVVAAIGLYLAPH